MPKAIALYCSPRRHGNSETLLDRFTDGMAKASPDWEITRVYVSELKISPCNGLRDCDSGGKCIYSDDFEKVLPGIYGADAIIIGTPVFFYGFPASAKALIDRCQCVWAEKYLKNKDTRRNSEPIKWGFVVSTAAAEKGMRLFDGVVLTAKVFLNAFNASYKGEYCVRGVDGKGEVLRNTKALDEASKAGENFAKDFVSAANGIS